MKAHYKSPAEFTISACTIAKNEEKTIARSINSYKKYVDEIIIVDTGSTDNTVKIAESLGAKVLHFEWCNDFAAAKNVALDAAKGDWILFLDADEYFANETCENLRAVIFEANLQNKNSIGCRMENIDSDSGGGIAEGFAIRVFKAGTRYKFAIHEEIRNDKEGINVLTVDKTYFYLMHTGYSNDLSAEKCKRNLEILLRQLTEEKDKSRIVTYYLYLSDAYYGIKKYEEAREYAKKYISQAKDYNVKIIGCETKPYLNIIQSLEIEKADAEEIHKYVEEFLSKYPDCSDAVFASGRDCMRRRLFSEALMKFEKAVEMSENYGGTYMESVAQQKSYVYNNCGMCEEALHNTVKAMNWYFKVISDTEDYQVAIFNLLRVVRGMPQKEVDNLVESLYLGASQKKHLAVISALMSNYMSPQLIKCYAAYRTEKKEDVLDADITAYILAGEGKYEMASNLFLLSYKSKGVFGTGMRGLLTAALSKNEELIKQALEVYSPVQAFALGLREKPEFNKDSMLEISAIYIECTCIRRIDYAIRKIDAIAGSLDNEQLMTLSVSLSEGFAFEVAYCAAQNADISAESVFMQGYCLYRMNRLYEATDLLMLAKKLGYDKPSFDEIYNNIEAIHKKNGAELTGEQKSQFKAEIDQKIEAGDYDGAYKEVGIYTRKAEVDTDIYTALSTLLFYYGQYKRAAITVECGLLKDENNFDLLYNAGCIYEKLDKKDRARIMYLKALNNCADSNTANELKQMLQQFH